MKLIPCILLMLVCSAYSDFNRGREQIMEALLAIQRQYHEANSITYKARQAMTNAKERKAALRKAMLSARDALSPAEKRSLDETLCRKINDIIRERNARVIHSYLPFGSEADITPLLQSLLDHGYTIVCPRSLPGRNLENLVLHSLSKLEQGRFGTLHPAGSEPYTGETDLYIVPGLGFDPHHYRLGYGSGYYDKFFSAAPGGYKLGVCYPFQLIDDFPREPHDVKLDAVLY